MFLMMETSITIEPNLQKCQDHTNIQIEQNIHDTFWLYVLIYTNIEKLTLKHSNSSNMSFKASMHTWLW
jgi:hypothetical protein